ncbi:MAG: glycosyltransferase [Candidatus Omnitrophica bacterium]|nr:glycosyltransferase [Candidatus Omnitrophota bacterium]
MSTVKILFLIDKLVPAGTQTNLLEIVKRLDRNRFKPYVIALMEGGELEEEFESVGVEPIVFNVRKVYGPRGFRALSFLTRFMKAERIDFIQTHFSHADILGSLAGRFARVRKIVTARRDEGFWRSKGQLFLSRYFNQYADRVLVNSQAVREAVKVQEGVSSRKIHVIHNGVDLSKFYPSAEIRKAKRLELGLKDHEFVMGMIANMRHEVKGHRFMIKALSYIAAEATNVKLVFVGDGPLETSLERYADHKKVLDQILFLGARRDVPELTNAMDLICAPSLSEGFSNTVLEAMATGKPVIATNVGGNPEVILNGETGILIRPRDARAIAEQTSFLIEHVEIREKLGHAARKQVESEFSVERMVKQYEEFYTELLIPPKRRVKVRRAEDKFERPHLSPHVSQESFEQGGEVPHSRVEKPPIVVERRSRRIRLLQLIWSLDLGGAEQVVMDLARGLDRQKFKTIVCCLNNKGRYAPSLERTGIKVIALHKRSKFDPFLVSRLKEIIRTERIDLIHTHLYSAHLWGRMAAKATGVPCVSSEHGMDEWRTGLRLTLDRWYAPVSKRMIFVSEAVKQFYMKANPSLDGRCRIIHNGVDVASFQKSAEEKQAFRESLGLSQNEKVIGIVGRLVPEKAHVDFIEAIQLLVENRKDILGLVVGEGALLDPLKKRVEEAGLERHVLFTGFRRDVSSLYQVMDVLALCSLREGFPLTILEAMATGVPVVATEVGGVLEMAEHEQDSLLVPPSDSPALANAIHRVLEDEGLRAKLIENAKRKVSSRFSIARMVRDHESLYAEVLASQGAKNSE